MLPGEYQRRFGSYAPRQKEQNPPGQFAKRTGSAPGRAGDNQRRPRITSFTRCIRRHIVEAQLASY
jgi:hypothetical protein